VEEIWVAVGLMLVAEGLLYGGFPHAARRLAETVTGMPETQLRVIGIASIAIGVGIVWLARG
jgi:uncharacterized protein YjeT (DUF2065 family)